MRKKTMLQQRGTIKLYTHPESLSHTKIYTKFDFHTKTFPPPAAHIFNTDDEKSA